MRKFIGFLLFLAGVAMTAYQFPSGDREDALTQVTQISTPQKAPPVTSAPRTVAATNPQGSVPRTFSPQRPLFGSGEGATAGRAATEVQGAAASRPVETVVVAQPAPAIPAQSNAPQRRLSSSKPGDEAARDEFARDLQRELKRVGCYDGDVDGSWGTGSRRAMSAFTDRVNATLPVEEPDYILLTLVQGHSGQACGKGCPSGQSPSNEGKCVANSVLAGRHGVRKSSERNEARTAETRLPPERRVVEPRPAAQSHWSTTIVQAPVAPLPGRMTVGASTPVATAAAEPQRLAQNATAAPVIENAAGSAIPAPPAGAPPMLDPQARLEQENAARLAAAAVRQDRIDAPRPRRGEPAPVVVYRAAPQRYFPPPTYSVGRYQAPAPTTYSASARNWKQTIFNDIARSGK